MAPLVWSAGYYFFLLSAYYVLKPIRDELGIRGDLDKLPWLWTGTTIAMLVAAPIFAALVSRYPRRTFLPVTYRFFAVNILVFYGALEWTSGDTRLYVGYAFFIWASVFNLFAVSVFWGFMADMFNQEQGKRLFGMIAVGGTAGAIFGASVPALLATRLGPGHVMLFSVVLLELAVQCIRRLIAHFSLDSRAGGDAEPRSPEPGPRVLEGIRLILGSPYLLLIAAYMLLFTVTTTFLEFERLGAIKRAFATQEARTSALGWVELSVNALTLTTQLLLTGRLITNLGIRPALLFLPALTLIGFVLMWVFRDAATPVDGVVAAVSSYAMLVIGFFVFRRSMHFAVDRPTREVLYTVLGPEEKYKSKSFIDTFVYRGGDLLGAWASLLITKLGGAVAGVAALVSAVWFCVGFILGGVQRTVAQRRAADSQPSADST